MSTFINWSKTIQRTAHALALVTQDYAMELQMTREGLSKLLAENPALTYNENAYQESTYLFGYPLKFVDKTDLGGDCEIVARLKMEVDEAHAEEGDAK